MPLNRLKASKAKIIAYMHNPDFVKYDLLTEIYQFQLIALATITNREEIKVLLNDMKGNQSKLQKILSSIDKAPIHQQLLLLKTKNTIAQLILLTGLMTFYFSMLLILFTGPIALMLGVIMSSIIMTFVSLVNHSSLNEKLFLYQEGFKALDQPFFSRSEQSNDDEIQECVNLYIKSFENEFYERNSYWSSHGL